MLLLKNIVNQLYHLLMAKAEKTGREFYLYRADEASSYLRLAETCFHSNYWKIAACWSILAGESKWLGKRLGLITGKKYEIENLVNVNYFRDIIRDTDDLHGEV